MGNDNSTEQSPDKFSKPRRILSTSKNNKNNNKMQNYEKIQIIQNLSKFSKNLSKPKNIMPELYNIRSTNKIRILHFDNVGNPLTSFGNL